MQKKHVQLKAEDRETLETMRPKRTMTVKVQKRVESLLLLGSGLTYEAVSKQVGLTYLSLRKIAKRYGEVGLECLKEKPRPGRPSQISGVQRAKITALACCQAPEGHSRWTLRLLADKVVEMEICDHLSHVYLREILKKTNYSRIGKNNGALAR